MIPVTHYGGCCQSSFSYFDDNHQLYLRGGYLGSTFATTNGSGTFSGQEWYHAYGRYRGGHELSTENRFTGQKLDGAGLMYFNARYYDPRVPVVLPSLA